MRLQLSTYFLARPKLQEVVVRAIKKPQFRQGKNENEQEFVKRAIKSFKQQKKANIVTKRYFRTEFDIKRLESEVAMISEEIKRKIKHGGMAPWWQNQNCCFFAGMRDYPCDFLPCCEGDLTPDRLPEMYRKVDIEEKIDK